MKWVLAVALYERDAALGQPRALFFDTVKSGGETDVVKATAFTRSQTKYPLASGWRLVLLELVELPLGEEIEGLFDATINRAIDDRLVPLGDKIDRLRDQVRGLGAEPVV